LPTWITTILTKKIRRKRDGENLKNVAVNTLTLASPLRNIAIDEGGIKTLLDSEDRSYIPGKPNPNCFEFYGACDGFMMEIIWEKGHAGNKYARPESMADLIMAFAKSFEKFKKPDGKSQQPFIFYLDARFSSIELMRRLHEKGFKATMSLSSVAKPRPLWPFMRDGMEKREWRILYLDKFDSTLTAVRAKKKAYVYLLSNYWSGRPITVVHNRIKPPRTRFNIHCPEVQKTYNMSKNHVDIFNSQVHTYQSPAKLNSDEEAYFKFFVQALLVNAFTWWKGKMKADQEQYDWRFRLLRDLFASLNLKEKPLSAKVHWPGPLIEKQKCNQQGCDNKARKTCKKCSQSFCDGCMAEVHRSLWK